MANAPPPEPISIDAMLSSSSHLTRQEVMARRSRRLKQLAKIYRAHYWALMEELKIKYKEYYWKFGKSPFKEDYNKRKRDLIDNNAYNTKDDSFGEPNQVKLVDDNENDDQLLNEAIRKCAVNGCKATPMALTKFCHSHILLDSKQELYKGCTFIVKSAHGRHVLCGKPVLRSTVPVFCPPHFQKAETYMARALKKAGLNISSPSKVAPKLHLIVKEFVHQIQAKRLAVQKENVAKAQMNEDKTSS